MPTTYADLVVDNEEVTLNAGDTAPTGDITVGYNGTGILNFNGITIPGGVSNVYLGRETGSSGTINFNSGSMTTGGYMVVGYHGTGAFHLNGGDVTIGGSTYIGDQAGGGGGTMTIGNGTLTTANLIVGQRAKGVFTQNGGEVNVNSNVYISGDVNATGHADSVYTINAGSLNVNDGNGHIYVGNKNTGTMNIGDGVSSPTVLANRVCLGMANGTLNMASGTLTLSQYLLIGQNGGTGVLDLSGTGSISVDQTYIADQPDSTGVMTIRDTASFTTNRLVVGQRYKGTLTQTGGAVQVNGIMYISGDDGGDGHAESAYTISDGTLTVTSGARVGNKNAGTMTIGNGTATPTVKANTFDVGGASGTASELIIKSGDVYATGTGNDGRMNLGVSAGATGKLTMTGGTLDLNSYFIVGVNGAGIVDFQGGKITVNTTSVYLGDNAGSSGAMTISNDAWLDIKNWLVVGQRAQGTLTQNGGKVNVGGQFYISGDGGGGGHPDSLFTMTAGTMEIVQNMHVGNTNRGTVLQQGGDITATALYIGNNANANGKYTMTGGSLKLSNNIFVGEYADSEFIVGDGIHTPIITANAIVIGDKAGINGTMSVASGNITTTGFVPVGDYGNGELSLSGGSFKIGAGLYVGNQPGSSGKLDISGDATLSATNIAVIGQRGPGEVNQTGGTFIVNGTEGLVIGSHTDANHPDGIGTYHLAGGLLKAEQVTVKNGSSLKMTNGGTLQTKLVNNSLTNDGGVLDLAGGWGGYNTTSINGSYTQGAGATLQLGIFDDGTLHINDILSITDDITLDGTLHLLLTDPAQWTLDDVGTSFQIFTKYDTEQTFARVTWTETMLSSLRWDYNPMDGSVYLGLNGSEGGVPEPATWVLMLGMLAGLLLWRKRRS